MSNVTSYVRHPSQASAVLSTDTLPGKSAVRSILLAGTNGIGKLFAI